MLTQRDLDQIQALIQPIIGKRAWGVKAVLDSYIYLEFGSPRLRHARRPQPVTVRGEWLFWVTFAVWRLERDGSVIAGSQDRFAQFSPVVEVLEGKILLSAQVSLPALDVVLTFEDDLRLRLFIAHHLKRGDFGPIEGWNLYTPENKVLTAGASQTWSHRRFY